MVPNFEHSIHIHLCYTERIHFPEVQTISRQNTEDHDGFGAYQLNLKECRICNNIVHFHARLVK